MRFPLIERIYSDHKQDLQVYVVTYYSVQEDLYPQYTVRIVSFFLLRSDTFPSQLLPASLGRYTHFVTWLHVLATVRLNSLWTGSVRILAYRLTIMGNCTWINMHVVEMLYPPFYFISIWDNSIKCPLSEMLQFLFLYTLSCRSGCPYPHIGWPLSALPPPLYYNKFMPCFVHTHMQLQMKPNIPVKVNLLYDSSASELYTILLHKLSVW